MWVLPEKTQTEVFEDVYTFLKIPFGTFQICQFTLRKRDFTTVNSAKLCVTPSGIQPNFLAKFPDSPWLFWTQVPLLSLTLARNELQGLHMFPNSKSMEFKRY